VSEPGAGTSVTLRLPASNVPPRAEFAPSEARAAAAEPARKGSILLVEDELSLADLTSAVLEQAGFEVTVAHSVSAALSILRRGTPVDIVFSDIVMAGGANGVELANTIRSDFPDLPIVLTTGFSDVPVDELDESLLILAKPYDPEKLCAVLERRIAESRPAK
jgi:two-component system NtrC family sensor kinase